jgi:hypothetical protein
MRQRVRLAGWPPKNKRDNASVYPPFQSNQLLAAISRGVSLSMRPAGSPTFAPSPLRPLASRSTVPVPSPFSILSSMALPAAAAAAPAPAPPAPVWWRYLDPSSGQFYYSGPGGEVTWEVPRGGWLDAEAAAGTVDTAAASHHTTGSGADGAGCVVPTVRVCVVLGSP